MFLIIEFNKVNAIFLEMFHLSKFFLLPMYIYIFFEVIISFGIRGNVRSDLLLNSHGI